MFIILVSYRARGLHQFRREQLRNTIINYKTYFELNKIKYKIVITEQNNDNKFNRGFLLNVAFLESEKIFRFSKKYMHMNCDYTFNLSRSFPDELVNFEKGFMVFYSINNNGLPILGSGCAFDVSSYEIINGFPNDIWGWGGDDWAIYHRIQQNNICLIKPEQLYNSGFIIDENNDDITDTSLNSHNICFAQRNDFKYNGLNSINYILEGHGEFHDGGTIFHYLVNNC